MIYLNPLLLVPDKRVQIFEDPASESENATYLDIITDKYFDPSLVTAENFRAQNVSFELWLNMKRVRGFYAQSGLKGNISLEEFKFAFLVKELSLIRYGAVEYVNLAPVGMPYEKNQVWEYIFNLLELRRCRYRLACDLPAFSKYLGVYAASVRKNITMEMISLDMNRFQHVLREFERVRAMLEDLYGLVVFNRAVYDSGVVEYSLPFVMAAERGDILVSADASKTVYNYVLMPNELHKAFRFRFLDAVADSDEVFTEDEERPAIREDEAVGFYRDVLLRRIDEIARIRNVFKRIFTMTVRAEVFEGDADLRKQQQIYVDSLTGDEGRTFLQRRFRATTMDVVILRDVSFSTDLYKEEYAEAIVAILASLEGIAAVRTAQIDFSDIPRQNKTFAQKLSASSIAPYAFGGTLMAPALEMVREFVFKASKRFAFIVTDGEIEDPEACGEVMEALSKTERLSFFKIHITPEIYGEFLKTDGEDASCSLGMLDKALYGILLRELAS
jgi:hypothetical protein